MSSVFWTIWVVLCCVCISLLTWEWEHPQWDTVFQVCRGGLKFDLLDTLLLLLLRMWFVLFTGRASRWLLFSLVSTCPFHWASPQQPVFGCLGLAQLSAEHHISLIFITFFLLFLFSGLSRTSLPEALLFSASTTPNFLASSKLLRIYSILLFRSLILFVTGQQLVDGYQSRH